MNNKIKYFFLSMLTLLILSSCSNLANDLQKRKEQNLYNIKIQASANGSVAASKTAGIKAGEEIILSVTATSGYEIKSISVVNTQNKDVAVASMEKGTTYKFTMPASDVTVGADFEKTGPIDITNPKDLNSANGNVLYRIEHYQQDVDDLNSYTLYAIQRKRGVAGEETEGHAQPYAGFINLTFAQQTIAADGSTVVEIYYNRKTITYTFDPNGGSWDGDTTIQTVSGLYGALIPLENPKKSGYDLTWDKTKPQTFEAQNHDFIASWSPRNDTKYTVEIYHQNTDGLFELSDSYESIGTTDEQTNVSVNEEYFYEPSYNQEIINGNGSTVVKVYCNRIKHTVTINSNGGTEIAPFQVFHGGKIQLSQLPVRAGYRIFECFEFFEYSDFSRIFDLSTEIEEDITLTVFWLNESIEPYKFHRNIRYLPENTGGTGGTNSRYVLFGDWPQSLKEESVNIFTGIPPVKLDDVYKYSSGEYSAYFGYIGDDGCYYIRKKVEDTYNYYRYEPIKWRIMEMKNDNTAVLVSEKILTGSTFDSRNGVFYGSKVWNYLNSPFYYIAFSKQERSLIVTYSEGNEYGDEYNRVYGSVYLLSDLEINLTMYNCYSFITAHEVTDYGLANKAPRFGYWWLRSGYDHTFLICTGTNNTERKRDDEYSGVLPAITVYLPEED